MRILLDYRPALRQRTGVGHYVHELGAAGHTFSSERLAVLRSPAGLDIGGDSPELIAVSTSLEGTLTERMSDRFPWMLALNAEDRELCATEILAAARASFATKQPPLAIAELTAWKETATAVAAGFGGSALDWLDGDDATAVERP